MDAERLSMLVIFVGIVVVTVALIVASPLPRRARATDPSVQRAARAEDDVSTWAVIKLAGVVVILAIAKGIQNLRRR